MEDSAQVRDKSVKPPGVLPRNAQTRVIAGLAILMILVMIFSGRKSEKPPPTAQVPPVTDANQGRIQEYRQRIEEQAKRLQAEQAELLRAKSALAGTMDEKRDMPSGPSAPSPYAPQGYAGSYRDTAPPEPKERDWRIVDQEKRAYQSRFASNVAFSAQSDEGGRQGSGQEARAPRGKAAGQPKAPNPDQTILEGTVIETTLVNRLDGDFSGPVNCMVTIPVYDSRLRRVLIPAGSRVLGKVNQVQSFGQRRLAIAFHRLILPDGQTVELAAPGLNQLGETGLHDKVNNHYFRIFGASLAIGAVAGLAQAGSRSPNSAEEYYRRGVSDSLAQSSMRVLDRYLNILPTLTIEAGHRVKVYLTGDLEVPTLINTEN